MGLFDIFKKKEVNGPIPGTLFFHEDDYCMVELTPIENLKWLKQEMEEADEFSEKHFVGNGWTSMYVVKERAFKLLSRDIDPGKLIEIIDKTGFPRAPAVTTGYGSTAREDCPNTFGFGKNYSVIYFNTRQNKVDRIWFTNLFSMEKEKIVDLLYEIGKEWNLILIDWFQRTVINLADKEAIIKYYDQIE